MDRNEQVGIDGGVSRGFAERKQPSLERIERIERTRVVPNRRPGRPRAARARARGGSLSGAGRSAKTYVGASTGRSAVRSRRSALPTRAGGKCPRPRATRGPRKNALARDENPLRTRRGNRRSSRGGIELHLASKAIGLGGPGGESHVLCVTLRTGATAENADIGRRLRGASGRLRGTHAWERRGERSVVVVHSEPEKHAVGSERSVERDAATRRVRSRRGLGKAPRATGRVDADDVNPPAPKDPVPVRACALRVVATFEAGPFTSRVFSSHKGCEKRHAGTRERVLSRFWVRCVSIQREFSNCLPIRRSSPKRSSHFRDGRSMKVARC